MKKLYLKISIFIISSIALSFIESLIFFKKQISDREQKYYPVLVANKNIEINELISDDNTKIIYMNIGNSMKRFILNSQWKEIKGKKTNLQIKEDTPLLFCFFDENTPVFSVSRKIPEGKRLFELNIDLGNLSYFLKIHDYIDIIAEVSLPNKSKVTMTLLSGIEVIGMGNKTEDIQTNENNTSLSFYLTPNEVQALSLIRPYSQFSISMRNPNEKNKNNVELSSIESILNNPIFNNSKKGKENVEN